MCIELIPNKLILPEHMKEILFDHASYAIEIIVDVGDKTTEKDLISMMNNINEIYKESIYEKFNDECDYIHSMKRVYRVGDTNRFRLYLFLNDINGNELTRDKLVKDHCNTSELKLLDKCFANDTRPKVNKIKNFIPVYLRLKPCLNLGEEIEKHQASLIFNELLFAQNIFMRELKKYSLQIEGTPRYKIQSIEINLDLLTPKNIEYATSEEIEVRLSREILISRKSSFVKNAGNRSVLVPNNLLKYILKDLNSTPYIDHLNRPHAGIPALQGWLQNKSILYVADKEIPDPRLSEDMTILYNLTRFELRLTANERFGKKQLVDLIKKSSGGDNSFENLAGLKYILGNLKVYFFNFLQNSLNTNMTLTSPQNIQYLIRMLNQCNPNTTANPMYFKTPYCVNIHHKLLTKADINFCLKLDLLQKRPSRHSQVTGLNWEFQNSETYKEIMKIKEEQTSKIKNKTFDEKDF